LSLGARNERITHFHTPVIAPIQGMPTHLLFAAQSGLLGLNAKRRRACAGRVKRPFIFTARASAFSPVVDSIHLFRQREKFTVMGVVRHADNGFSNTTFVPTRSGRT